MKKLFSILLRCILLLFLFCSINAYSQDGYWRPGIYDPGIHTAHAVNGMNATPRNFKWFTTPAKNTSKEAAEANAEYQDNPETGLLFAEAPCDNCYELIGKRTETTKTFLKSGANEDGSKTIYEQTSNEAMHYKDTKGNWLTIKTQLEPDADNRGVYAAYHQPIPVSIHTQAAGQFSSIGKDGAAFKFNHDLELIYAKTGAADISLGKANWTNYTAGDDGVYVTNAWPGIDMEIYVMRGAIKTNFIINHAMPAYADGKLLVRDRWMMDKGLSLYASGGHVQKGLIEVRDEDGEMKYAVSEATAWEKNNLKGSFRELDYYIGSDNTVDIALPGDFLNRAADAYPVIIDPLVSTLTSVPLDGSSYSPSWAVGCSYPNPANVPANCTVTDIQYTMAYTATGGAIMTDGAFKFSMGTCGGAVWSCYMAPFAGTCTASPASSYSIFYELGPCVPPPACAPYPLNITLDLSQRFATTAACATTYVYGAAPFVITVIGHTVELTSAGVSASPSTICAGSSSTVSGEGTYGVPPYTYSWSPAGGTGSSAIVSPSATTAYILTVTDACGVTASGSATITVEPASPITGTNSLCVGANTTLGNAIAGGTWSSSNTSVATITTTGDVAGLTTGTTVVAYTTPLGCVNTIVVTVTPTPDVITGTAILCAGSTTTLYNSVPGGSWSSGGTSVASVDEATGVVSALSAGTVDITYATSPGCFTTAVVTVNLLDAISGYTGVCAGNTITLTDAAPGGTWSSTMPAVASVDAGGVVTGVAIGTATISYIVPSGCWAVAVVTVTAPTSILGNLSVCVGSVTSLSNASPIGTWTSSDPSIAAISSTGTVSGIVPGTSTIGYLSLAGCLSTAVVTVNPLPDAITGDAVVCVNATTTLADATPGGTWSSGNILVATIDAATGIVLGVSGGTADVTYTLPTGCIADTIVIINPLPLPIGGALNICKGATTMLTDASAGGVWSSSNVSVASIAASGLVTGLNGGTAIITYTLPTGCLITAIAVVTPIPLAPTVANVDICQLATPVPQLTAAGEAGAAFLWYTASSGGVSAASATPDVLLPGITTWYVSQVVNGCEGPRAPLQVKVHHHEPFGITTYKPLVCQGDTLNLTYSGTPFAGDMLAWSIPPGSSYVMGNAISPAINVRFDTTIGHNYVTLTVGDGFTPCDITDSVAVNVILNVPPVRFYVKPDVCVGDEVVVSLNNNAPGVTDYTWDFDTAVVITGSSNHGGPFTIQWANAGRHFVTMSAINNASCPARLVQDTVDVHPYPDARIAPIALLPGKTQVCIGDSVLLSPLHFVYGNSYVWSPTPFFNQNNSDNIYGKIENTEPVKLTVTDPYGCTSSDIIATNAQPCCTLFFPNAFTPGADINNIFRPVTLGNHAVHIFRIANRWGQTVYETSNEKGGWDGTFNGVPQDVGTYFYFITYDCAGSKHTEKGEVTLIR